MLAVEYLYSWCVCFGGESLKLMTGAAVACSLTFCTAGRIVEGQPRDGCAPLQSSETTKGSIAVLERGSCMFAAKVCPASAMTSKDLCRIMCLQWRALLYTSV